MPEEGEGAATARRKEKKQNKARQVKRRGTASAAGYMGAVDCDLRLLVAVGGQGSVSIIFSRKGDCGVSVGAAVPVACAGCCFFRPNEQFLLV